jgi:hypothetical protein
MPTKKAPNAPTLKAAIDNAGGELQRGGAGGSMSFIGAMPVKKYVPGSVQGVLPLSKAISSRRCGLKMAKLKDGSLRKFYWAT